MTCEHHKMSCRCLFTFDSRWNSGLFYDLIVNIFDCSVLMTHVISDNAVLTSFDPTVVLEHQAVVGGFKCLYWAIKHEIAHHTNCAALQEPSNILGSTCFDNFSVSFAPKRIQCFCPKLKNTYYLLYNCPT